MNQMFTAHKIYSLEIIGKLINKTKRATFPYPPFFETPCSIFSNVYFSNEGTGLFTVKTAL